VPLIGSGGGDEVQPGGDDNEVQPGGDEGEVFSRSPVAKAKYPCAARVPSLRGIVAVKSTQAQFKPTNPIRFGDLNKRSSGAVGGDR